MWLRALAIAAVLLAWVVVRRSMRLPVRHPWLVAIVLGAASAVASDASDLQRSAARAHVLFTLAALLGFGCVFMLGEGLRREVGGAPPSRRRIAVVVAVCAITALACGFLPPPRDRIVADIGGATFLLNLLDPLLAAPQRVGSWLLGIGIVAYALIRTVLVMARLHGGDVVALEHVLDSGVIVVLGAGLVAFVLESAAARKTPRAR
jgi:hypothetical protein